MMFRNTFSVLIVLFLTACSGASFTSKNSSNYQKESANGRYSILKDHGPEDDIKLKDIPDLIPKDEPRSRGGNKSPYEVWGKKYWVMDSAVGFTQTGTASWYGKKFHGHKTSNGEIYDMYQYSAAHKSLPIPTYVKVTNLENGRQVIVRVNDRGPFHEDRIIDLSYAAAAKLDYHKKGVARVKIEVVSSSSNLSLSNGDSNWRSFNREESKPAIRDWRSKENNVTKDSDYSYQTDDISIAPPVYNPDEVFTHLQLGAFVHIESAQRLKQKVIDIYGENINVFISERTNSLYKVVVGPYEDSSQMNSWSDRLRNRGFDKPVRVNLLQ